jgi:hypothetical protein
MGEREREGEWEREGARAGVCANADVVVVKEQHRHRITMPSCDAGALLRTLDSHGSGDGQLNGLLRRCVGAIADFWTNRVSVYRVDGEFVRNVDVGVLSRPTGVACYAFDELVAVDNSDGEGRLSLSVQYGGIVTNTL